jgi:hypothetical protein
MRGTLLSRYPGIIAVKNAVASAAMRVHFFAADTQA